MAEQRQHATLERVNKCFPVFERIQSRLEQGTSMHVAIGNVLERLSNWVDANPDDLSLQVGHDAASKILENAEALARLLPSLNDQSVKNEASQLVKLIEKYMSMLNGIFMPSSVKVDSAKVKQKKLTQDFVSWLQRGVTVRKEMVKASFRPGPPLLRAELLSKGVDYSKIDCFWAEIDSICVKVGKIGIPPGSISADSKVFHDGLLFSEKDVKRAELTISALCDAFKLFADIPLDERKLAVLRGSAKVALTLSTIKGGRNWFVFFLANTLPIPFPAGYDELLSTLDSGSKAELFEAQQYRIEHRYWDDFNNLKCLKYEPLRHWVIGYYGSGNFGQVTKVIALSNTGKQEQYACKVLEGQRPRLDFKQEFENLKRISNDGAKYHMVTLRKTYQRGTEEYGLLVEPAANSDLRTKLVNYVRLEGGDGKDDGFRILFRSFGCLSVGMYYLHEKGIRHRDIKPENFLYHEHENPPEGMKEKEEYLWTDFGVSTIVTPTENANSRTDVYQTPETKHDNKSDIYPFGFVFLETISVLMEDVWDEKDVRSILHCRENNTPYKTRLTDVQTWIKDHMEIRKEAVDQQSQHDGKNGSRKQSHIHKSAPSYHNDAFYGLLQIASEMVQENPNPRPTAKDLVLRLSALQRRSGRRLFCSRCDKIVEEIATQESTSKHHQKVAALESQSGDYKHKSNSFKRFASKLSSKSSSAT